MNFFCTIFEKACNELIEFQLPSFNQNDNNALSEFIKNISGLYSSINYANNKFTLLSHDNKGFSYYETTILLIIIYISCIIDYQNF